MRSAISAFLLSSLVLSVVFPAFGQGRVPAVQKRSTAPEQPVQTSDTIASAATRATRRTPVTSSAGTEFESLTAYADGRNVLVRWTMSVENDNVGFNVFAVSGNIRRQLNQGLIPGGALRVINRPFYDGEYQFVAPAKEAASTFVIETIPLRGGKTTSQLFTATRVGSLSSFGVAGTLSADTKSNSLNEQSSQPAANSSLRSEIARNSLTPDPVTQKWVASQPGVKLGVRTEGIYKVTKGDLQAAGFAVDTDPALWQLYVDGREQSINVAPNGDYIEFYGRGIDTIESDTRVYFLVVGPTPGKRMEKKAGPSISPLAGRSYSQTFTRKERKLYVSSVLNGDNQNFFGDTAIFPGSPYTLTFNLSGISNTSPQATVNVRLQGLSFLQHNVGIKLNNHDLGSLNSLGRVSYDGTFTVPVSFLVEGANSLTMTASVASEINLFDQVNITFDRSFVAQQNTLSFYTQNLRAAEISGFTAANIRVFDTTYDGDAAELTGLDVRSCGAGCFGTRVPARRAKVYFATENGAILSPATIEANNPSTLSTNAHNAQLVIISYKDFLPQANVWRDYRIGQGTTAEVVDVRDIYDEFSYGSMSSNAIKDFLQYAGSNWQTPPQYVLLLGDATYNPRHYDPPTGQLPDPVDALDYIPAKMVDTLFGEAPSDDALVDFNSDGLAEMAIGRVPARDAQTVANIYNKVVNFEQLSTAHTLDRGALFVSDYDPNTWDFSGMSHLLSDQLPGGTPSTFVWKVLDQPNHPLNPTRTQDVVNGFNAGNYVINYSGHGATGLWANSGDQFFGNNNVTCNPVTNPTTCINNPGNESIVTALTCFNGYFVRPDTDGLSERFLKATNGGAVAVWSSTGETTPDVQQVLALRFYQQLGQSNIGHLGDLIVDAKSYLAQHPPSPVDDVLNSWVLLGDPMLKVRP